MAWRSERPSLWAGPEALHLETPGDSIRLTSRYPTRVPGPSREIGSGGDCCCLWGHGSLCGHCCQELTASPSSYRVLVPSPLWTRRSPNFTPSKMEARARSERRVHRQPERLRGRRGGPLCKEAVAGGSQPGSQLRAALTTERATPPEAAAVFPKRLIHGMGQAPLPGRLVVSRLRSPGISGYRADSVLS